MRRRSPIDNIFVFLIVFSAFAVPAALQHRVLFWGILGALVMRAVFIVLGAALLQRFHWVIYIFGAFLVFTGIKLLVQRAEEVHPERNPLFRLFRRCVPAVHDYHGGHFMVMSLTSEVVKQLIASAAERSVSIVSFVSYWIEPVIEALDAAVGRGVVVQVILESPEKLKHGGGGAAYAQYETYEWPD